MNNHPLHRLVEWYSAQCNGVWEHQYGIKIATIDNPGFILGIDLVGTPLENVPFDRHEYNMESDNDWFTCWKENGGFEAAGAPSRLDDMIECFLDWVNSTNSQ